MSNFFGVRSSGADSATRQRTPQTPRSPSNTSTDSSTPERRGRQSRRSTRRRRSSFYGGGGEHDDRTGDADDRTSLSDSGRDRNHRFLREDERGRGYSDVMLDEAASLGDEFPVPLWSHGSRLAERRILHAVDAQTEKLEVDDSTANNSVSVSRTTAAASQGVAPLRLSTPAGAPPLVPSTITDASPLLLRPRMQEAAIPADPRTRLLDLVITNTTASITLAAMETAMDWNARYAAMYGPLLEYLQSYQSIFVVSPVDDRVRLRRMFSVRTDAFTRAARQSPKRAAAPLASQLSTRQRAGRRTRRESAAQRSQSSVDRRTGKPSLPSAEALAAHIGSISYSCVAERLDLDALETVYHRRGYTTAIVHAVLHVSSENCFDLFLFASGAVVWWGMHRKDHWMVEDDFLSATGHLTDGIEHRYNQADIDALFPIWCSYELDEQCEAVQAPISPLNFQPVEVEPALERLAKVLCFDHYLVPATEPARSLVMLTFSHSIGRSARVDYFEFITKWSHRHILGIPAEFTGLLDYFSTKRRVTKLEGEIAVAQLAIQTIHDTPEVLWNVAWLQGYYDMAEQQNTSESRLTWFASRSDTLLEQLSHIKGRRHRLFMLGSDVFLIVLLILDVMFMTSRLVAKLYFKVEEDN